MGNIQRLHHNGINELRDASVAASSVRASNRSAFPVALQRSSKGQVQVAGGFTGANDINLRVRIKAGSSARATSAVYAGGGDPSMSDVSVDTGLAAQTVQVRLVDPGTVDVAARLAFYGVELVAKALGPGGNAINIAVDNSGIVPGTAIGHTLDALSAGQNATGGFTRLVGAQWDFGATTLTSQGELVPDAPRLRLGTDPAVYRHWRAWEDGGWAYYLDQELGQAIPAGTAVYALSGSYTVTVTDGVTPEVYTGIVTLYDLLQAIRARSSLIAVVGVISASRVPAAQNADELPLRTAAYVLPVIVSGSEAATGLDAVSVNPAAVTQELALECTSNTIVGAEKWAVKSSVSGPLAQATTGVPYASTPVSFTIPQKLPDDDTPVVDGSFALNTQFIARGENEGIPTICLYRPVLGAQAENKTLTLTWTARPPVGECDCGDMNVTGKPDPDCLGIDIEGEILSALADGHAARLQDLYDWYVPFMQANSEIGASGTRTAINDGTLAAEAFNILRDLATDLYTNADAVLSRTAWAASTDISLYAVREPTTRNNYLYRATVAGTTGGSEPTWPTTIGNTVVDGSVTWTCIAKVPEIAYDDLLSAVDTDTTALAAIATEYDGGDVPVTTIAVSTAYTAGNKYVINTADDTDFVYLCVKSGTTGTSIADLADLPRGQIEVNGSAAFMSLGPLVLDDNGDDISTVDDFTSEPHISRAIADFATAQWLSQANRIRAFAGIDAGKSEAGTGITSACWSDPGDAYYWRFDNDEYLPAFNGVYYHSVQYHYDPTSGQRYIVSTQEFGFAIRVGCPERLKEGDKIVITIGDVEKNYTYEIGDTIRLPIVAASPVYLRDGANGTNERIWSVVASVLGTLPDYTQSITSPALYSQSGIEFRINEGQTDPSLDAEFSFAAETGAWEYSIDAASWVDGGAIPDGPTALVDGLTVEFVPGVNPAFVAADIWEWDVVQHYAPSRALAPLIDGGWQYSGSSGTITIDTAGNFVADSVCLWVAGAEGETITVEGLDGADVVQWTETPTATAYGLIALYFTTNRTQQKIRVTIPTAGAVLRWAWAGLSIGFARDASECVIRRRYSMSGAAETNRRRRFTGSGKDGRLAWQGPNWLSESEAQVLSDLVDWAHEHDDEPVIVTPNWRMPAKSVIAQVVDDVLEVEDLFDYQPQQEAWLKLQAAIDLRAVVA